MVKFNRMVWCHQRNYCSPPTRTYKLPVELWVCEFDANLNCISPCLSGHSVVTPRAMGSTLSRTHLLARLIPNTHKRARAHLTDTVKGSPVSGVVSLPHARLNNLSFEKLFICSHCFARDPFGFAELYIIQIRWLATFIGGVFYGVLLLLPLSHP